MSVRDNLIAARAKIANPENWASHGGGDCKNSFCAATALNDMEDPASAWGALWQALPENYKRSHTYGRVGDIFRYNDSNSHEDILALFDRAIEAAGDK